MRLKAADFPRATESQVQWMQKKLGVTDKFFADFLEITEKAFSDWKAGRLSLNPNQSTLLSDLWMVTINLRSTWRLENPKNLKEYFNHTAGPQQSVGRMPPRQTIPWAGTSLLSYLQDKKREGLDNVHYWERSLKFR